MTLKMSRKSEEVGYINTPFFFSLLCILTIRMEPWTGAEAGASRNQAKNPTESWNRFAS